MGTCGASSSSGHSSLHTSKKSYDVFLSFRGEDTRSNFTNHLYAALGRKKIKTYIDEESLERGDKISPALLEAIQNSKISIIVFSKGYAFSSWCLSELVHILECHQGNKQMVIPIFYEVDPSHIRKQEGSYGEAFQKHEERFQGSMDIMQKWREALTESAGLSGWDSRVTRPESKLLDKVVDDVLKKLSRTVPLNSDGFEGLIGMENRFHQVDLLLSIESPDIRIVGLWGMGGIGKTTLAKAVFGQIFSRFQSCCFLENVREKSEKCGGLKKLRKKLIAKLLDEENIDLENSYMFNNIERRLKDTRVLVVLDDVSKSEQLEELVGDGKLLGLGSRILVTTRNQEVLRTMELPEGIEKCLHGVEQLNHYEALELFNLTAFNKAMPSTSDYTELSMEMKYYSGGNPLAIKVLGSHLRSLRSPSKENWEGTLKKFKDSLPDDIQKVLRISYDGLDKHEKNVFLDIACFFKNMRRACVEKILDACGFSASIGIEILIDRSLITVDPFGSELQMHDLVQEMGRQIVCQESKNKGVRSRLWKADDIFDVLENNEGTGEIQGIFLDLSEIDEEMYLEPSIFRRMNNLRLLKIYDSSDVKKEKKWHLQDLEYLPRSLRYLEWHDYPLKSLPRNFKPRNLIELKMPNSQLEQLGVQDFKKLRGIDLSHSSHLTEISDLSGAKNLERINLEHCTSLPQVYSHTLENLTKLVDVNLRYCNKLQGVPDIMFAVSSLRDLMLQGLSNLKTLPMTITTSLVSLNLDSSGIMSLPFSIGCLKNLSGLSLKKCTRLTNLPRSVNKLSSLDFLDLAGCSSLDEFPDLPLNINYLDISGTMVKEVPSSSVEGRFSLNNVNMSNCKSLKCLPASIFELGSLYSLSLDDCSNLENLPEIPEPMDCFAYLHLSGSGITELPSSIGNLIRLGQLSVERCKNLKSIPSTICNMSRLYELDLSNCPKLEYFCSPTGFIRWDLDVLNLEYSNITEIPANIKELSKLKFLCVKGCKNLRSLPELPVSLEDLVASECTSLELVSNSKRAFTQEFWDYVRPYGMIPCTIQSLFFDCLKLDKDQHHDILIEFKLIVLRTATLFVRDIFGSPLWYRDYTPSVRACFPGNEIPEWFEHQSEGSLINIKLSAQWQNSNFLGFVFCVVGSSYSDTNGLSFFCGVNLRPNEWYQETSIRAYDYCTGDARFPTTSNSGNVFMLYECLDYSKYQDAEEASFDFVFKERRNRFSTKCKVIKCGVHMLCRQDLEEFGLNFLSDQHLLEDSGAIPQPA